MFGGAPDRPIMAVIKGIVVPLAVLPASAIGFIMKPTPLWLGVAGLALAIAVLGVRRLMAPSRWYQV